MGVCVIRGLVAATFLIALGQLRGVKSTPVFLEGVKSTTVFLEPNSANGENTAIPDTSHNVPDPSDHRITPSQSPKDSEQRNPDSENGDVNTVTISNNEDDDTNAEYSGDLNDYGEDEESSGDFADGDYGGDYSDVLADYNGTSYEYDYDYDNTSSTGNYSEQSQVQYDNDDDEDTDLEYGDEYSENDDSEDDDDDDDDGDDDDDDDDDYDDDGDEADDDEDDDDDYDGGDEGHGQSSHHHHHLITGQNGASIEVDDDGKVYMFLKVNETFDPTKYYLEVGNNTKLLLDLGEAQGNVTKDYEFVTPPLPDGEEKEAKGTAGNITLLSSLSAKEHNVHGTGEQNVVLLNVADLPEDREGSNKSITNTNSTVNNETTTLSVQGKGGNAVTNSTEKYGSTTPKSQENKTPTLIPRLPNDTHISVGWSSATVSDERTTEPPRGKMSHENSSLLVSRTPSSIDLPPLTTTINYLGGLEEDGDDLVEYAHDGNGQGEEGDLDEAEEEKVTKSILDMDDDELQTFLASNPDLIESDNEEYEANVTEPEMTTSALMLDPHRDVIENFNGSESSLASPHADLDEEEEPTETEPEGDDLTWFLIPSKSVNQTDKTSVNNASVDYGQIYLEFMASYNLTDEERIELGDLERLRQATESLGGLGTLREDQTKHHVVRRQLKGTEACGSFSRRRRDTGSTDKVKVNSEGQRYKRGVSNVGRRLEMGNPAFRQLYNQYKNMCNFIAMVAFEK